jgi:glyoxylase-like metal-dependent hydrolase (beta-lactamase superfamily II)
MPHYICKTCGAHYAESATPPAHCLICEDERQYVGWEGQQWTTLADLRADHHNTTREEEPGLLRIVTEPSVAIGHSACLISSPAGNVLWEPNAFLDDATVAAVKARGGITAIAASHPHLYGGMVEWSHAFDNAPIYLHASNQPWVMRPDPAIHYWEGETCALAEGLTIIRCGGHFPGSSVLHWAAGAEGRGAILAGDTIYVVPDRRYVSFMYSYPNHIPLNAQAVNRIVAAVAPYAYDRIYSSWPDRTVVGDGQAAVARSRDRYLRAIADGPAG